MGFFDSGAGGYDPITGILTPGYDPSTGQPVTLPPSGIGSDYASDPYNNPNRKMGYDEAMSTGPSLWDRIVGGVTPIMKGVTGDGSMGVDNKDQPNLQMPQLGNIVRPPSIVGPQQQPDSPGGYDPMTGITTPGYDPSTGAPIIPPPTGIGSDYARNPNAASAPVMNPPLPPTRPPLPTGMDIAGDQPFQGLPSDAKLVPQNGMQVPVIGSASPVAPVPPGTKTASLGEAPKPEEKNFLQRLITGSTTKQDDLEINRRMAALGAGLSNIHGNGKAASFARGYGSGIKGYQARGDKDIEQATEDFNNHMKMLLTGSTLEKNQAYIAMQQERMKWLGLGTKGNGGDSWRNTPYGHQITIDTQVETTYRKALDNLGRDNSMNYEQKQAKEIQLKKDREEERAKWYGRYGIDPKTGAEGYSAQNPIDTSKKIKVPFIPGKDLNEQSPQFQAEFKKNVPPGAAYRLPGDPPNTVRWNSPATATSPIQQAAARAASPNKLDDE